MGPESDTSTPGQGAMPVRFALPSGDLAVPGSLRLHL